MNFADEKTKLSFASDYMKGAHPAIMERLVETNMMETGGYGLDPFSDSARDKNRMACEAPRAAEQRYGIPLRVQPVQHAIDAAVIPAGGVDGLFYFINSSFKRFYYFICLFSHVLPLFVSV